jgi:hypothetical protein
MGAALEVICLPGSRSWEPTQAMPPRNPTTIAGIDQTINSMRPEYDQSGIYCARALLCRNHQANPRVSTITGMTTASMIVVALSNIVFCAAPTGPCGSRTPLRQ